MLFFQPKRGEDEERNPLVGEGRDERRHDAREREVERARDLERDPAALGARVGGDVVLAADDGAPQGLE